MHRYLLTKFTPARHFRAVLLVLMQLTVPFSVSASSVSRIRHPRIRGGASAPQQLREAAVLPSVEAERIIARRARQALLAMKAGDMAQFATFVHPQKGVRFSPYASVLPEEDHLIKRDQLTRMWASSRKYNWGSYDGSGDPIRLTFRKYQRRFIFDHDFSRAKEVRYNGEIMGHGTTINNIREAYPTTITVEHFFPGFDEKRSGMDWTSLWLVFEKSGRDWFLVGVVHNEWTI